MKLPASARIGTIRHVQFMSSTPFISPQAVETWDTLFRWRERGRLRDVTVVDTWERVATSLAAGKPGARPGYKRRLLDALCTWQLLLDERVLASAGTAAPSWNGGDLCAVLNLASFVRAPCLRHATFDYAQMEEAAALAVYALDDAAGLAAAGGDAERVRIGMIGMSDALAMLGLDYDSAEGRECARAIAQALATGCLAGSTALASDYGKRADYGEDWRRQAAARACPNELAEAAMRYGARYLGLTAITAQPALACFSNNVSDALDPLLQMPPAAKAHSVLHAGGYAATVARRAGVSARAFAVDDDALAPAQLRLRSVVQPWIDEPISCPLLIAQTPDAPTAESWRALAQELKQVLHWRVTAPPQSGVAAAASSARQ